MTNPLGVDDFFVLEAGEYLERLTTLGAGPTPPTPDELVRYTRALRGSALMANQVAIARAAGGLESIARAYRDGKRTWSSVEAMVARAVGEIRVLIGRVGSWTEADSSRAERLALELEAVPSTSPTATRAAQAGPDAGVRAFVAREGAMVASALDQAAHALRTTPRFEESLQAVLRRMQPLRGLAALTDFPPLPELLDGVERAVTDIGHGSVTSDFGSQLFEAGAKALSRAARDVAQSGRPDPEAEETRRFADLLLRQRGGEVPIVSIESLFFDDGGPTIIQRGTAPKSAPATALGRVELVSRGDHLCQVADELERGASSTQRDLRLHALGTDLRSLAEGVAGELGARLVAFADLARESIANGRAGRAAAEFAGRLREAGQLLRAWSDEGDASIPLAKLSALSRSMLLLGTTPPPPALPAEELEIVPIESLAPDRESTVPPGVLRLPEVEHVTPPAMTGAAEQLRFGTYTEESADLAGSFITYTRLIRERGLGRTTIEQFLGSVEVPAAPAPEVAPKVEIVPPPPSEPEADIVDIADLCYRGRGALQRAALIKLEIRNAFAAHASTTTVYPLIDELLDLVELALVEE